MTKSASTPAILAILVSGSLAALPAGCRTEQVAIGQQNSGGQTSSTSTGGATNAGGAGGGSAKTGGITGAGGSKTNAGGATASGGNAGGIAAVGGANASGGVIGAGGTGAGGSTGCAPGWTMCCGQCLSPQAGICAPCPGTGGSSPMGGAPSTGGRGGVGSGGVGAGGSSGSGGSASGGASGATCGGLRGMSCSTNQFCDLPAGSCNAADVTGTCADKGLGGCPAATGPGPYAPECGCDGKTYANDCSRVVAGVAKLADGVCAPTDAGVCPAGEFWCPGCPSLGIAGSCGQVCPAVACPAPDAGTSDAASGSCSAITTQAACDSRSDCHSVFADPGTCGCAATNCCMRFSRCADGGHANCTGPAECTIAQPACLPPYTLGYTSSCFEGCVLQTECGVGDAAIAPPVCPSTPPANALSCGSTNMTCFYDNCPSTGRTQAICTGGTWAVQTAACGTVSCNGPSALTCPSGQMCLITESGAVSAQCVTNSCGQGPVTPACGTNLDSCVVNASLTSGVTVTCNTCPTGTTCA